jgi:hypothetical protein
MVEVAQQVLLHGGDVVHAFGHHPRHFLEAGEAVEFERIELLRALGCQRLLRLHLGLGLDFDFAQLVAQADHVFRQVQQGSLECQQLALDAAAGNRDFAGLVDQPVDQVGADAQVHLRSGYEEAAWAGAVMDTGAFRPLHGARPGAVRDLRFSTLRFNRDRRRR